MNSQNEVVSIDTTFATAVDAAVKAVLDGEIEAHNAIFALKSAEETISRALSALEEEWLNEAAKYADGRGAFDLDGYMCKIVEGNKKDYTTCNDEQWNKLREDCDKADEARKAREKFLQSVDRDGILVVDEETGNVDKIFPPATVGKTYIRITKKK